VPQTEENIAKGVMFFAVPDHVTGQSINIDGGANLHSSVKQVGSEFFSVLNVNPIKEVIHLTTKNKLKAAFTFLASEANLTPIPDWAARVAMRYS
jgi:hypothetical protein